MRPQTEASHTQFFDAKINITDEGLGFLTGVAEVLHEPTGGPFPLVRQEVATSFACYIVPSRAARRCKDVCSMQLLFHCVLVLRQSSDAFCTCVAALSGPFGGLFV